jgi:hypothetical protein
VHFETISGATLRNGHDTSVVNEDIKAFFLRQKLLGCLLHAFEVCKFHLDEDGLLAIGVPGDQVLGDCLPSSLVAECKVEFGAGGVKSTCGLLAKSS